VRGIVPLAITPSPPAGSQPPDNSKMGVEVLKVKYKHKKKTDYTKKVKYHE